jgi:hypothetical protein
VAADARAALAEDTARGADAARRAVADNVRRLEGTRTLRLRARALRPAPRRAAHAEARRPPHPAGAYFSGRALSGGEEVFPLSESAGGHIVRLSRDPPLRAFVTPEQLPADLAPYLSLDASGAPRQQ